MPRGRKIGSLNKKLANPKTFKQRLEDDEFREKQNLRLKTLVLCPTCNITVQYVNKSRHNKSNNHINNLNI